MSCARSRSTGWGLQRGAGTPVTDVFNDIHMGETVEQIASRFQITRAAQDEFAAASQAKATEAVAEGRFAREISSVAIEGRKGERVVYVDEHIRPEATKEKLAAMKPVFKPDGTITAGNASGLNDGAAAVLVGSAARLAELGLEPLARVAAYASAARNPLDMGLGPVPASRAALEQAGWVAEDVDIFEINL